MSNDVEFTINPSTVLADLKANSNSRKQRSFDIIYKILEKVRTEGLNTKNIND